MRFRPFWGRSPTARRKNKGGNEEVDVVALTQNPQRGGATPILAYLLPVAQGADASVSALILEHSDGVLGTPYLVWMLQQV